MVGPYNKPFPEIRSTQPNFNYHVYGLSPLAACFELDTHCKHGIEICAHISQLYHIAYPFTTRGHNVILECRYVCIYCILFQIHIA